jgi:hypothetical protein
LVAKWDDLKAGCKGKLRVGQMAAMKADRSDLSLAARTAVCSVDYWDV